MIHGAAYRDSEDLCRRLNSIRIQKKSNPRSNWPWWTHSQYSHLHFRKQKNNKPVLENIPVADSLERGLPPGRTTRREYQIRLLETRYPCSIRRDTAEPSKYPECGNKNVSSESSGSFLRSQPVKAGARSSKTKYTDSEATGDSYRRTFDDSVCCRVFQSVGSDLIAKWLTPKELHRAEKAFRCSWDWGQAWHRGKVRARAIASAVEYLLPTCKPQYLLDSFNRDSVFSALWHLLPLEDFVVLAEENKHLKSIRRLVNLRS